MRLWNPNTKSTGRPGDWTPAPPIDCPGRCALCFSQQPPREANFLYCFLGTPCGMAFINHPLLLKKKLPKHNDQMIWWPRWVTIHDSDYNPEHFQKLLITSLPQQLSIQQIFTVHRCCCSMSSLLLGLLVVNTQVSKKISAPVAFAEDPSRHSLNVSRVLTRDCPAIS